MPIKTIPNQPLVLLPYNEPRQCQVGDDACMMMQPLDPIRMQFKQISFGLSPGNCDPQFSTLGSEVITNGDFSSGASWTLVNATIGSHKACFNGSPAASVKQTVTLDASVFYKFIIVVSGITTGTMVVSAGGTALLSITADGTYTFYAHPGLFNDLEFSTTDSCDGCIESVSLKQLFPCWIYDNTDFVASFNSDTFGNKITHTPGSDTTFHSVDSMVQGGYYQCQIKVSGRTQGSVQMFAGDLDILSTPITKNGIFNQFLVGNETGASVGDPIDFLFVMDADFDGTIEYVYTFILRKDFICTLLQSDGTPIADLSSHLVYTDNYVTLQLTGLNSILDYDGNHLPYGCYKIAVTDRDGTSYTTDGVFDDPDPAQTNWTESGYFINGIASNEAAATSDGSSSVNNYLNQNLPALQQDHWYVITFRYKSNFVNAGNFVNVTQGGYPAGSVNNLLTTWQTFTSEPFQKLGALGIALRLYAVFGDDTAGNTITIDDLQIYAVDQYVSNCITYQLSFPDTHLIIGRSNFINGGTEGTRYGFGFLFQPRNLYVFFFIMRLKLAFRKPSYPSQFIDGEYSTGRHYKSFASAQKVYEVVFEPTGEVQHDCIAVTIQCPTLYIQGVDGVWLSEANRYQCITDKYVPEYDEHGANKQAASIIQVQHIQDIVKISNV